MDESQGPGLGRSENRSLNASVHTVGCSGLRTISIRGFRFSSGEGPHIAGFDLGPSPDEHLLGAIGAILARSASAVACTKNIAFDRLDLDLSATIDDANGAPRLCAIDVRIRAETDSRPEAFEHFVDDLVRHSSINTWLAIPITFALETSPIDPARIAADDWVI